MTILPFAKFRNIVVILALLLLSGGIGYRLGEKRVHIAVTGNSVTIEREPPPTAGVDFSLFWDVWDYLFRYHIDRDSFSPKDMVYGAIQGMVSATHDPYSSFFTPKENEDFKEDLGGEFDGIGAQLGIRDNRVIVVAPLSDTPAEKAGLLPGDLILKVDNEDTTGWTVQEAVTKIRGPRGSKVVLQILHPTGQKPVDVSIVRGTITVPSVEMWMKRSIEITEISGLPEFQTLSLLPGRVAYLKLSRFGDNSNDEWNSAVRDILAAERVNGTLKGLILDLRNNPGGYLDGSVFIASEFLPDGIVVSQMNSDGTKEEYPVNRKGNLLSIKLIVLINQGSASASEIVAGALRDHTRATLVGTTSFGKGSVQTPYELSGGTSLHVTTGKWLLPSGTSISGKGVTPDITVDESDAPQASTDAQLAKAVSLLVQ